MALHLNRIRVIYRQDKEGWTEFREKLITHEPKRPSDELLQEDRVVEA